MPSLNSLRLRAAGVRSPNNARWISSELKRDARLTTMFLPSSFHSRTEPGPTPSFRRTSAGTEICPCAVTFDCAIGIFLYYQGNECYLLPRFSAPPCLGGNHNPVSFSRKSSPRYSSRSLNSPGGCYSSGLLNAETGDRRRRILDVGCGIHKQAGAIGLDRNPASRADVLADLDRFPYPFANNSFDRLTCIHVIEHVNDVIRTMEEFHRLVRCGGSVRIETPHYTDFSSFCDPTHKSHLNSFSFRYFGEDDAGFGYYSPVKFREISVHVKLLAFWRWLGFEFLVNHFPRYRRFWEHYLCYVVRGKAMAFEFEVLK